MNIHTFNGKKTRIHYNSDMSGNIIIQHKYYELELSILGEDILDFVAEYVRSQKISKLEQMDSKEILGLE